MVDKRITDLAEYTGDLELDDYFEYVDTSDTTDNAAGSSRKIRNGRVGLYGKTVVPAPTGVKAPTMPGVVSSGAASQAVISTNVDFANVCPIVMHRKLLLTEVSIVVTTAGGGGTVVRVGLYAANEAFVAGSRIVDWGTLAATSTGRKALAISTSVDVGNYLVVTAINSTSAQLVQQRVNAMTLAGTFVGVGFVGSSTVGVSYYASYNGNAAVNGLPATLGTVSTPSNTTSTGYLCPVFFDWTPQ